MRLNVSLFLLVLRLLFPCLAARQNTLECKEMYLFFHGSKFENQNHFLPCIHLFGAAIRDSWNLDGQRQDVAGGQYVRRPSRSSRRLVASHARKESHAFPPRLPVAAQQKVKSVYCSNKTKQNKINVRQWIASLPAPFPVPVTKHMQWYEQAECTMIGISNN